MVSGGRCRVAGPGRYRRSIGSRARLVPLLIAFLGVVAACSGDDDGAAVRSFDEIEDTPIEIVAAGPGTATLEVTTTIDVACSVVYGPDTDFGQIAVDDDMQGGSHADHHPLLVGLEPGREYQYRMQGTDAQGHLYQSEIMSFVAPDDPTADIDRPGANLAVDGAVLAVSSEYSDEFAGANAIDGDPSTEWSSAGDGDEAFIEVDLGAPAELAGVGFWTRTMGDGSATTTRYAVFVDGTPVGEFDAAEELSVARFSANGQVVRVEVVASTGGNTGLRELEIYGA